MGLFSPYSKHQAAGEKVLGHVAVGLFEKALCCLMFDNAAVVQKDNVAREPAGLADIVGDHDDLDAAALSI